MAVTKLVLVRHGESQWNKENRFTGWYDVDRSADSPRISYRGKRRASCFWASRSLSRLKIELALRHHQY